MSVLIRGMEMPKSCGDCPCLSETYCCCVDGVYPYDCNILIQDTEEGAEFIGRLSNCPLVEVPTPHGRLIDTDAVSLEGGPYEYDEWCKWALVQYQDAPTIIPAEEGE